jgi:hypothetical protein
MAMTKRLDEPIEPHEVFEFIARLGRLQRMGMIDSESTLTRAELEHYSGRLANVIVHLPPDQQAEALAAWQEQVVALPQTPHWAGQNDTNSFIVHDGLIGDIQRDPDHKFKSGTIATMVNHMTPKARGAWKAGMSVMEAAVNGGKIGPFMPFDAESVALTTGRPESEVRELVREHKMEQVEAGLQKRMSTDADRAPDPVDLRETISAAVDHHEGTTNYDQHSTWTDPQPEDRS